MTQVFKFMLLLKNSLLDHNFKTTTQNKKKINTVHNLITFSIVFTNKNEEGGGSIQPPSPSKLVVFNTQAKLFNYLYHSIIFIVSDCFGLSE